MKTLKLMLLTAFMMLASSTIKAQQTTMISTDKDGWMKIAETTVNFDKDKDVLMVFGKDRFRKLQFMVMDAPIEITNMIIYYEGGNRDTINLNARVEEGARSKVIDLAGDKPEIGRIVFNYSTSNLNWIDGASSMNHPKEHSTVTSTASTTGAANESKSTTKVDNDTKSTTRQGDVEGTSVTETKTKTGTTTKTKETDGTAGTKTMTTTNSGHMNHEHAATNPMSKNTSMKEGESKSNNSTKARVILWGMK